MMLPLRCVQIWRLFFLECVLAVEDENVQDGRFYEENEELSEERPAPGAHCP